MTFDAAMVGVPPFANNGPRTDSPKVAVSELQLGGLPIPIPVQIVGPEPEPKETCTTIWGIACTVNSDDLGLKLNRDEGPVEYVPLTREDRSRTRSAVIKVPDDNMAFGFRRTSTCCPTIRSAGTLTLKRNPVVSIGVPSA